MTRNKHRAKCIKAIDSVLIANGHFSPTTATSAFDALHEIAQVIPIGGWTSDDLTNPPERADYMQIIETPPEGKPHSISIADRLGTDPTTIHSDPGGTLPPRTNPTEGKR